MLKDAEMMRGYQETLRKRLPSGWAPEGARTTAPESAPTRFTPRQPDAAGDRGQINEAGLGRTGALTPRASLPSPARYACRSR